MKRYVAGKCELPPSGWSCTRHPPHEGPCTAVPAEYEVWSLLAKFFGIGIISLSSFAFGCYVTWWLLR